ncbi:type II secretion system protein GspL [Gallaecimonas mangrovi]|uniref:type II secretion system protein GspL n=1 Tax=Gallaecimonas mangrovi TaxID=2291597 RepID=UPI0018662C34|nr:type II secretion system protein GspL [Gallaecimonas mangrovi]
MNTVVIRLPVQDDQPISWLHWSATEQVVLASGTLPGAETLTQLNSLEGRVLVLVPGSSCFNGEVKQANKSRQFMKAVPFMLEEELADDVDSLHFLLKPQNGVVSVLAVRHQLLQQWLGWLDEAGIEPWKLVPDYLALPWQAPSWTALALDGDLLLRTGPYSGLSVDAKLAEWVVAPMVADEVQPVEAYGEVALPLTCTLTQMQADLPLSVAAKAADNLPLDLLTGPYQRKSKSKTLTRQWWPVAASIGALLVVALVAKAVAIYRLDAQADTVEKQISQDYGRLFPGERLVSAGAVRAQLRGKLKNLGTASNNASLLAMLNDLSVTFAKIGNIKPDNLRFDGSRGELRLLTTVPDFSTFERLKQALSDRYQVDTGGQSSVDGGVSGTLILRSKG